MWLTYMKIKYRIGSLLIIFSMLATYCTSYVNASERDKYLAAAPLEAQSTATEDQLNTLTPELVNQLIEEGEAEVSFEIRSVDDFTTEEILEDEGLRMLIENRGGDVARASDRGYDDGRIYTLTVDSSMGILKCFSMPRTMILAVDVGNSGSSSIYTKFYVEEYVTVNGVRQDDWPSYITFTNFDVTMGCGKNTIFTATADVSGNDMRSPVGNIDFSALFGILSNALGFNSLGTLLDALGTVVIDSQDWVYSEEIDDNSYVRLIRAQWGSIDLIDDSAYLMLECLMSAKDTFYSAETTYAAAQWTFDVYAGVPHLSSLALDVTLTPTVEYSLVP